jgi:hypothetical protein
MQHIQTNLSKEVGRLHDWSGPMWSRRYRGIPIAEEEDVQYERLRYLLSQGCKEGLVENPLDWPGVNSAWQLWHGITEMEGEWVDRTALYNARRKKGGALLTEADFTKVETIELSPMPLWEHLSPEEYQARVRNMIEGIAEEARERNRARGKRAMGVAVVLARHPHSRPAHLDTSPAPHVHCSSKEKRSQFWEAFREFMSSYRAAAERMRHGELTAKFPPGCFTPRRQFVPRQREPEPRARAPGTA